MGWDGCAYAIVLFVFLGVAAMPASFGRIFFSRKHTLKNTHL